MSALAKLAGLGFKVNWRTVYIGWLGVRRGAWQIDGGDVRTFALARLDQAEKKEAYHIVRLLDALQRRTPRTSYEGDFETLNELKPLADMNEASEAVEQRKWFVLRIRQIVDDWCSHPDTECWEFLDWIESFLASIDCADEWFEMADRLRTDQQNQLWPCDDIDKAIAWHESWIQASTAQVVQAEATGN